MSRLRAGSFVIIATLFAGGCASTGATPRPFPTPGPAAVRVPPGAPGRDTGYEIAGTALHLRGTPYRNGGADPAGFDCSGFVSYVFAQNGLAVPRTVTEQYHQGRQVDPQQLQAGDLVFFSTVAPGASHVGIAIGGDEFLHAPSSAGEVRVERLSAAYWSTRFVGARRIL